MRTSILTAVTHDGKDVLLAGKSVSLLDQKEMLKPFRGVRVHDEYREISYQENDGHEMLLRFLSPEQQKQREQRLADVKKEQDAQDKIHEAVRNGNSAPAPQPAQTELPAPKPGLTPEQTAAKAKRITELKALKLGELVDKARELKLDLGVLNSKEKLSEAIACAENPDFTPKP